MCPRCRHASALTNNAPAAFAHKRVLFVGDSISEQLYAAFSCLAQNMAPSLARPAHVEQTTAYTFGSMTESALGLGLPGTPGFLLHKFRVFDVIVLEIGSHYHAWANLSLGGELHALLHHDGFRELCSQRACVVASPAAAHFFGGDETMEGFDSFNQAQADCKAHKFETACGGVQDAFGRAHEETIRQIVASSNGGQPLFSVLPLFGLTQRWAELHPGYRLNRHDKLCDCLHFCYDERVWEPVFSTLAKELYLKAMVQSRAHAAVRTVRTAYYEGPPRPSTRRT
jgi:hypothetical protein